MPIISQLGYCKYIMPEGGPTGNWTEPQDVILGRCVNFSFNYSWQGNICTISTIRWKPGRIEYNETTGERTFIREGLESSGFKSANSENNNNSVLIIKFGETSISLAAEGHRSIYLDKTYQPDSNNDISITTTNKFLLANFTYDYTGTSGVRYLVEIKNIKIPRFSKYENNVIFNKDGLNEMIDHFQKYPVIEVKSTLTNNDATSGKFGHIKVTRGADPNNPTEEAIRGFGYSTTENLICGRSFLPYSSGSYDLGIDYLEITTDSQYIKGKTYYSAPNSDASIGTISSLTDFQNALTQYNTLYTRHRWKNLYLSDNIGSESSKIGNIYATNGNFSESIKGKYLGLPTGLTGDTINIGNGAFKVDHEGNVTMNGSIAWGSNNPVRCVYHTPYTTTDLVTRPDPPAENRVSFEDASESDWHNIVTSADYWASMSYNGGKTWNTAIRINATDGKPGDPPELTDDSILEILKHLANDEKIRGLIPFGNKLALSADVILAELASFGRIEMDPYFKDEGNSTNLKGGFISFYVPSPISYEPAKASNPSNKKGWKVRLGFLKGNGDGQTATNGLGLVLYTASALSDMKSEMKDSQLENKCYIPQYNTDGTLKGKDFDKEEGFENSSLQTNITTKHLVLSFLILTQSGFGVMTQSGISKGDGGSSWCISDTGVTPHYYYRYWTGAGTHDEWGIPRQYRLWLDENNGGLYWTSPTRHRMYTWVSASKKTD